MTSVHDLRAVLLERSTAAGQPGAATGSLESRLDGVRGRVRRMRARRRAVSGAAVAAMVVGGLALSPLGSSWRSQGSPSQVAALPSPGVLPSFAAPPARLPLTAKAELASTDSRRVVQLFVQPVDGVADVELTCDAAGRVGFVLRLGDSQTQGHCDVGGATARLHLDAASTSLPSDQPLEVLAMFLDPPEAAGSPGTGAVPMPAVGPLPAARLIVGAYLRGSVLAKLPTPMALQRSAGSRLLAEGTLTDRVRSRAVMVTAVGGRPVTLAFTCVGDWAGLEVQVAEGSRMIETLSCAGLSPSVMESVDGTSTLAPGRATTLTFTLIDSRNRTTGTFPLEGPQPPTTEALHPLAVPFALFEGSPG